MVTSAVDETYHLTASSPCIDAGTDAGVYTDMDGDTRPQGSGFDIGADEYPPPPIEVNIDIKPGSDPNSINPNSKGVIPVAILTTPDFDATTVDWTTVEFEGASPTHDLSDEDVLEEHQQDVDGDGDVDFVFHFKTQDTGIESGYTEATLTGETYGGQPIKGTDSVRTVGKGK